MDYTKNQNVITGNLVRAGGRSLVYKFLISSVFSAPCLVVTHHEFFKNEGQAVIEFVEKLSSFIEKWGQVYV
jgi:hypothetical protein